jgi:hypothetical protein
MMRSRNVGPLRPADAVAHSPVFQSSCCRLDAPEGGRTGAGVQAIRAQTLQSAKGEDLPSNGSL